MNNYTKHRHESDQERIESLAQSIGHGEFTRWVDGEDIPTDELKERTGFDFTDWMIIDIMVKEATQRREQVLQIRRDNEALMALVPSRDDAMGDHTD